MQRRTSCAEETMLAGEEVGRELPLNSVVCFFGDLGAGKTTFIKGLAKGCSSVSAEQVHSPTFVYLHVYEGRKTLYHFDLYRLRDQDEFLSMGFEEYFFAGGICCIEWSERIAGLLPPHCIKVYIDHAGNNERNISITPWDQS